MLLPGPEAQQLATYIGWLMHRTRGGIVAGALFVLPSLVILIALSWIYMAFGDVPAIAGAFYGIKPAVTAIVVFAAWRIGSRALTNAWLWPIAAARLRRLRAAAPAVPARRRRSPARSASSAAGSSRRASPLRAARTAASAGVLRPGRRSTTTRRRRAHARFSRARFGSRARSSRWRSGPARSSRWRRRSAPTRC